MEMSMSCMLSCFIRSTFMIPWVVGFVFLCLFMFVYLYNRTKIQKQSPLESCLLCHLFESLMMVFE